MIELSNTNAQTIPAGQSVTFDKVLLHTGCAEYYRTEGPVFLTQKAAIYEVSFNGNIGGTAQGDAQIAITLNGAALQETTAKVVTAAAGDLQNVSASTLIKTPCCGIVTFNVLLTNTGTTDINFDKAGKLIVRRIA